MFSKYGNLYTGEDPFIYGKDALRIKIEARYDKDNKVWINPVLSEDVYASSPTPAPGCFSYLLQISGANVVFTGFLNKQQIMSVCKVCEKPAEFVETNNTDIKFCSKEHQKTYYNMLNKN